MSQHTKGPWKRQTGLNPAFPDLPEIIQIVHKRADGGARYVCDLMPHVFDTTPEDMRDEIEANAHLIAAAPVMLDALREASGFLAATFQNLTNGEWEEESAREVSGIVDAALLSAAGGK